MQNTRKIDLKRDWVPRLPLNDTKETIKVLSYNVLADSNIKVTRDIYPNDIDLLWNKKRGPMILE